MEDRIATFFRRHSSQARETLDLFRGAVSLVTPSRPCEESLKPRDTVLGDTGCRGSFCEGPGGEVPGIGETIGGNPRGIFRSVEDKCMEPCGESRW